MNSKQDTIPSYLKGYEELWIEDPHKANLKWFEEAKFGMFIHYGLYSFLGRGEWVQSKMKIPVAEYALMKENFTAHNFDVEKITDLALEAGMKYITLVTCHHDGFCLWDSKIEPFNSVNSPCGRDIVAEMAKACEKKGLGFFVYYTFMLNWRYPWSLPCDKFNLARPEYDEAQPEYLDDKDGYKKYIEYVCKCLDELLTNYGTIAGVWLDIILAWYGLGEEYIPIDDIYSRIRERQPQTLISWKQGATGTEDYASPEFHFRSLEQQAINRYGQEAGERARKAWLSNKDKHNEICATLQKGAWSFNPFKNHITTEEAYGMLDHAASNNANLLLNVGPLADGSIHPTQEKILRELGEKIHKEGYPDNGNLKNNLETNFVSGT